MGNSHKKVIIPDYSLKISLQLQEFLIENITKITLDYYGVICNNCEYAKTIIKKQNGFDVFYINQYFNGKIIEGNYIKLEYRCGSTMLRNYLLPLDRFVCILVHNKCSSLISGTGFTIDPIDKKEHIDLLNNVYENVNYSIWYIILDDDLMFNKILYMFRLLYEKIGLPM